MVTAAVIAQRFTLAFANRPIASYHIANIAVITLYVKSCPFKLVFFHHQICYCPPHQHNNNTQHNNTLITSIRVRGEAHIGHPPFTAPALMLSLSFSQCKSQCNSAKRVSSPQEHRMAKVAPLKKLQCHAPKVESMTETFHSQERDRRLLPARFSFCIFFPPAGADIAWIHRPC